MTIDSKNIVNLNLKKKKIKLFRFPKTKPKFDINKLQEAYMQIIQTKNLMMAFLILVLYV